MDNNRNTIYTNSHSSAEDTSEPKHYVLVCPCIQDPTLRARGVTTEADKMLYSRCIDRCRQFDIEIVPLPCPESMYCGRNRTPGPFLGRLDTPEFSRLLDLLETDVRAIIGKRGAPLAIIGVDSSPTCGVNFTYYDSEKQPGRGAFLARFHEIKAFDVSDFSRFQIYLAAPLFSEAEQRYNMILHSHLTDHFFAVYLPQEVGDTSKSRDAEEHRFIFLQHVRALKEADFIVAVIDGADADSGTAWEMGYAHALGKPVIALRTDFRCAGHHELVNLMLEQSSYIVTRIEDIARMLKSPRL